MLELEKEDPTEKKVRAKSEVKRVQETYIGAVTKEIEDEVEKKGGFSSTILTVLGIL